MNGSSDEPIHGCVQQNELPAWITGMNCTTGKRQETASSFLYAARLSVQETDGLNPCFACVRFIHWFCYLWSLFSSLNFPFYKFCFASHTRSYISLNSFTNLSKKALISSVFPNSLVSLIESRIFFPSSLNFLKVSVVFFKFTSPLKFQAFFHNSYAHYKVRCLIFILTKEKGTGRKYLYLFEKFEKSLYANWDLFFSSFFPCFWFHI